MSLMYCPMLSNIWIPFLQCALRTSRKQLNCGVDVIVVMIGTFREKENLDAKIKTPVHIAALKHAVKMQLLRKLPSEKRQANPDLHVMPLAAQQRG